VTVEVEVFESAAAYAPAVLPVVERFPAESSVLASLVTAAVGGRPFDDAVWLLIREGQAPVGAAIHIAPNYLILTPFASSDLPRAASALVSTLRDLGRLPDGVTGTLAETEAVVLAWERATGVTPRVVMSERLFEMTAPPAPPPVEGSARRATEADLPVLVRFFDAFDAEAEANPGAEPAEPRVRRRLAFGALILWELAGEPVSMAGLTNPAAGVSRVGPVYTPREFRSHGYGSAVTAAATSLGFERGARRVVLYTDLSNPTSNKIYQALGYRPINDSVMVSFRPML
jgi:RimJ/RimL family protein N-acetyltransferase